MTKEKTFWDSRKALWKGIGTEFDTNYSAVETHPMFDKTYRLSMAV